MKLLQRIALGLFVCLFFCVAALFAVGRRSGANHVFASLVIHRPPEQVWRWINEPDHQKQWISWLIESTATDSGRFHWVMEDPTLQNMKIPIDGQRTTFEPPHSLAAHLESANMFRGDIAYRLAAIDSGNTRIDYDARYSYDDWLANLLEPLVTPQAQKKLDGDLANLKRLVEQGQ